MYKHLDKYILFKIAAILAGRKQENSPVHDLQFDTILEIVDECNRILFSK